MTTSVAVTAAFLTVIAVVVWMAARAPKAITLTHRNRPESPLDHAERILAARYAGAQISAEQYERMLAILRK